MSEWIENHKGMPLPDGDTYVQIECNGGAIRSGKVSEFSWEFGTGTYRIARFRVLSIPPLAPPTPDLPPKPKQPTLAELQQLDQLKLKVDLWDEWRHKNACRLLKKLHAECSYAMSIDQFTKLLADNAKAVRDALQPYDDGLRADCE